MKYNRKKLIQIYKQLIVKKNYFTYGQNEATLTIINNNNFRENCTDILSQFKHPSMITDMAFLHNNANGKVMPHIDETRYAAINLPVTETDSCVQFFDCNIITDAYQSVVHNEKNKIRKGAKACIDCKLIEELYYKTPHCINVSVPHGVKNYSNTERITLSLVLSKTYTYNDVLKAHQNKDLLC